MARGVAPTSQWRETRFTPSSWEKAYFVRDAGGRIRVSDTGPAELWLVRQADGRIRFEDDNANALTVIRNRTSGRLAIYGD